MTDEEREDLNTFRHELVKQARWWKWKAEALEKDKAKLESENAELRARLDKAVELKFKIGDTIYLIQRTDKNPKGEVLETKFIDYEARNNSLIYIAIHGSTYFQFNEDYIGKLVFTDKSETESRLAELKGEKK